MNDNEKYIQEFVKDIPFDAPDQKHRDALKKQLLNGFPRHRLQPTVHTVQIWRIIMKSPITKTAVAAAIIIAAIFGIHHFGWSVETVAFADIIEPFLTARTATFKVTIEGRGVPTQEYEGMFMEPGRMRHTQPDGGTVIVDLQQGKMVTLLPKLNQAVVLELINVPDEPGSLNFFQDIRQRVLNAQPFDGESVQFLGESQIEGQAAIGYHVQKPGLDGTVWANAETKLPIQIEISEQPLTLTMSDIVFNVELDEELFRLDVPQGYTVNTLRKDVSEPTEEDLIESFRIWAEHMDGKFPSKMDRSVVNEFVQYRREKMKEEGIEPSIDDVTKLQQTIIDMTHGFPFVEVLPAHSDWHYAGQDVRFGDADKPIFWYRPAGSPTYRVIYGDLSTKDVEPQDLPK
jgi:outer membrane lipoprotein-sorting protein